jgi:hypothetical protein
MHTNITALAETGEPYEVSAFQDTDTLLLLNSIATKLLFRERALVV